ncbi:hypothetical protein ABIB27_003385 [Arthrobacter sp. UYEF21]
MGTKASHVLERKRLDLGKYLLPQLVAKRHSHHGAEVAGTNGRHRLDRSRQSHIRAQPEDRRSIPGDDAVVDDGSVDSGQQQDAHCLHQLEDGDGNN